MADENGNVSRKELYEMMEGVRKDIRAGFKSQNTILTELRLDAVETKTLLGVQQGEIDTLRKRDWYAGGLGAAAIYAIQYIRSL